MRQIVAKQAIVFLLQVDRMENELNTIRMILNQQNRQEDSLILLLHYQ